MSEYQMIQQALSDLHSADDQTRIQAIETLAEHQHTDAIPELTALMPQVDPGTRYVLARALGRIGDERAVPALLEALRGDDPWVRAAVTGALIQMGSPAVDGLVDALRDEDKAVRRAAAKAVGKIGERADDNRVVRGLSAALLDVDRGVRRFAAEALGRLGAAGKVDELREVLSDRDAEVRIAAFKALANIDTPEAQAAVHNWLHD